MTKVYDNSYYEMTALTIDELVNPLIGILDYLEKVEPPPILQSPGSVDSYIQSTVGNKRNKTPSASSHYDDTTISSFLSADDYSTDHSVYSTSKSTSSDKRSALDLEFVKRKLKRQGDFTSNVVNIEVPYGKAIEEVYDGVHTGVILGEGVTGIVRKVTHKATGLKYAVKCLDLHMLETEESLEQLRQEIFVMCELDHPNIVRLEEVYESDNEIYLVQELCKGGELFDWLEEQPDYHYTEQQCARLVKQMLSAVRYIHSKGIIHRDLKLENFLFSSEDGNADLKMIDFGLSKHFQSGEMQHEAVGSPYTVAPEVIRGGYDEKCDIWAIGVITYLLLSGDPPFGGCGVGSLLKVRDNILRGKFYFEPREIWQSVSKEAKQFIVDLLVMDPGKRPSARKAQKSAWLKKWSRDDIHHSQSKLNPTVVNALLSFKEYSDMRKLLCEVLSFTLLPEQIRELRKEFHKIDIDDRGEITLNTLKTVLQQNQQSDERLSEEDILEIFNAMRITKKNNTIHWHEFIAASLTTCKIDDRNLRLAFDRLDRNHKSYITFDDILDIMGNDCFGHEHKYRKMFCEGLRDIRSKNDRITYEEFVLLMKGQRREPICDGIGRRMRKEKFHLSLDDLCE